MPSGLKDRVAIVAGATRGAGRGIARALGEAGATVYCTGRSVRGQPSPYGRPETIEETAELVTAAGGTGIAVRVDHTDADAVAALVERVDREQDRLDVLVDSVAGEDPSLAGWKKIWDTDLGDAELALRQALVSHLVTAQHVARVMKRRRRGLIVEVTEGDLLLGSGNVVASLVKSALKTLAAQLAEELRPHRVAALAVTPGFLRSEAMLDHFGVTEATWRDAGAKDPHFLASESPLFVGRAIAALAADPKLMARSGMVACSWELARDYGVDDVDGRRPDWGEHFTAHVMPAREFRWLRESMRRHAAWLAVMQRRVAHYLGEDAPPVDDAR